MRSSAGIMKGKVPDPRTRRSGSYVHRVFNGIPFILAYRILVYNDIYCSIPIFLSIGQVKLYIGKNGIPFKTKDYLFWKTYSVTQSFANSF